MISVTPMAVRLPRALLIAATLMVAGLEASTTLPTGGTVTVGEGSISTSGSTLTVTQATDKLAVNWDSFSIGSDAAVHFVQPSASSVALNRVTGADASVIEGKLTANGHVFLVNPSGVLFAKSAQVTVGGLVATTLGLSDDDFASGDYTFSGPGAGVVTNEGSLVAVDGGSISLIAGQVVNSGDISAERGSVNFAAGSRVTLNLGGLVNVVVDEGAVDAVVRNGGAIRADGGRVLLTARGAGELAAAAISNEGLIEARTLAAGEFGQVELLGASGEGDVITLGGRIDVSAPDGGNGGFVFTSAARIELSEGLELDASAPDGLVGAWIPDYEAVISPEIPDSLLANIQLIKPVVCPGVVPFVPGWVDEMVLRGGADWSDGSIMWPLAYNTGNSTGGVTWVNDSPGISLEKDAREMMGRAKVEFAHVDSGEYRGAVVNAVPVLVGTRGLLAPGAGIKLEVPHVDGLGLDAGILGDE